MSHAIRRRFFAKPWWSDEPCDTLVLPSVRIGTGGLYVNGEATESGADRVIRAITDDGAFRVIVVSMARTVRRAVEIQQPTPEAIAMFGETLMSAVLVRETMAPPLRVQMALRASRFGFFVDSYPDGGSRGRVVELDESDGPAILEVLRRMPGKGLHQSAVGVSEPVDISRALVDYFHESEQVDSMVALGCPVQEGRILGAAGYIVQRLPEAEQSQLLVMTERLRDFERIGDLVRQSNSDPHILLAEVLHRMPHRVLGDAERRHSCPCSLERVLESLRGMHREMTAEREPLQITCDYCGHDYSIEPEELARWIEGTREETPDA